MTNKIYNSIIDTIGNTPLVRLKSLEAGDRADILVKIESRNPGGSVKDRPAYQMIVDAEEKGRLKEGDTIVEPTSGNMGIALALIGAAKGYKVVLVMPSSMSIERRKLMAAYGAELVLIDEGGMKGAVAKAQELVEEKGYFMPSQFSNEANVTSHYKTTGPEIFQATDGKVDAFVAGVGTAGTLVGVSSYLKDQGIALKAVAVEPDASPLLSQGNAAPHAIQGIGANFVPDNFKAEVVDEIKTVSKEEAYEYVHHLAQKEGILAGISSGGNLATAVKVADELGKGKVVVTVLPDTGERYLSTDLFGE
ncbi:cysteine synthase A [Floricoccus penangensis]|uniref:cysteine synthase A n=1 Tax=Floricoccus penangensis TaxID=1859475 RepID=UPI00203CFDD0|nr:cysteine synthase A [Floricoccus penangensis]URZ86558.1 cysteine synthase A [Floricoccus penangensis]